MSDGEPRPLLLAGPTAVGKSEIALYVAERLKGEIVSVDSMQVYRGLDVGTAKPTAEERRRVPHHLIDVVGANETFDAAQYGRMARAAVREIQQRGTLPILCGGTGLYFKAFREGVGEAPPRDTKLRAELERTPMNDLLEELQVRDPVTFEKIDRKNSRRVIRAVEVIRLTGRPFSEQQSIWSDVASPLFFCFTRQREDLHRRIDARVDKMFRDGLVEETRVALTQGLEANGTAMQAIGYRQVVDCLRGRASLADTIELVKMRTRQYAKRQLTWFRREPAEWIMLEASGDPATQAGELVRRLKATS